MSKLFDHPMNSQQEFYTTIHQYYQTTVGDKLPADLMISLCQTLTAYYYQQYSTFYQQYPKSKKRYASFQLKDLAHPYTFELIIKHLKEKTGSNYETYATVVLNMSMEELKKFEKGIEDFYRMF